jgi:hypothetical protein
MIKSPGRQEAPDVGAPYFSGLMQSTEQMQEDDDEDRYSGQP